MSHTHLTAESCNCLVCNLGFGTWWLPPLPLLLERINSACKKIRLEAGVVSVVHAQLKDVHYIQGDTIVI